MNYYETESEIARRKIIETKITNLETSIKQIEEDLRLRIDKIDSDTKEREKKFVLKDALRHAEDRVNLFEKTINYQNLSIEKLNTKFVNFESAQHQLDKEREIRLIQIGDSTKNQLNQQFSQLREVVEKRVVEINDVLEGNLKIMEEGVNRRNKEFTTTCSDKINQTRNNIMNFFDFIKAQINDLVHKNQWLEFTNNFSVKIRKEIDEYEKFKIDDGNRIRSEQEEIDNIKKHAEKLLDIQLENERKRIEEELIKKKKEEENKKKQEEVGRNKMQEAEIKRKEEMEWKRNEEDLRKKEEQEIKRNEEEVERKKKQEIESKRKQEVEWKRKEAVKRKKKEAAEKKRKEVAERKKYEEGEFTSKQKEEELKRKQEQEENKIKQVVEEYKSKKVAEEHKRKQEEETKRKQEEEHKRKQEEHKRKQEEEGHKSKQEEERLGIPKETMTQIIKNPQDKGQGSALNNNPQPSQIVNQQLSEFEARRRRLGEELYPKVLQMSNAQIAGKITGMLLGLDYHYLSHIMSDNMMLFDKVQEALIVLRKAWANNPELLSILPS